MKIGAPLETKNETRVALTPESVKNLINIGHSCFIQKGAGINSGFTDTDYIKSGQKL